jgi:DNA-binding transcriptional LysR family regulator
MDPQLLRAFVGVVDSNGFTAAARALNRTQSAVSLQIKRLEEQVGEPLFARTTRRVELTSTGGALLPYARRILRLHDEAAAAVDAVTQKHSLRFGVSDEHAVDFLPAVIPAFAAAHPDVQLEVECELSTRLIERLEEGELDLALTVRHGPTATGKIVAREQLSWVAGGGFAQNPLDPLPLALNPEGCIFRAHAFASLARIQRALKVVFVSSSSTGINIAVESGMAATVKRRRAVPPGCRVLDGERGMPQLPPVDVELHRASTAFSDAADGFVRLLLEEMARHDEVTVLPAALEAQGPAGERL